MRAGMLFPVAIIIAGVAFLAWFIGSGLAMPGS